MCARIFIDLSCVPIQPVLLHIVSSGQEFPIVVWADQKPYFQLWASGHTVCQF